MTADPRIHNLTVQLEAARNALQAEQARNRVLENDLLKAAEPNRVLTLAGSLGPYRDSKTPRLLKFLSVCEMAVLAADPLRSAPMTDTARVAHPEDTAVESAFESKQRQRANVVWVGQRLEQFITEIESRVAPDEVEKREKVKAPQCWKRPCRGARGRVGDQFCGKCGQAYGDEEREQVA